MINSEKLNDFFKDYEPNALLEFLRKSFGTCYIKTHGSGGLYIWYGTDSSPDLDEYSISSWFIMPVKKTEPETVFSPGFDFSKPVYVLIFPKLTEDQVINTFKYFKLRELL
jgi:hypothetical protein